MAERPAEVASKRASLVARFGPRLVLGPGNSHAPLVESVARVPYARPYSKMVEYLDALDGAAAPVPAEMRMLAALGPRMLSLAQARAAAAASMRLAVPRRSSAPKGRDVVIVLIQSGSSARPCSVIRASYSFP